MKKLIKKQKGFTLVELFIAGAFVFVLLGVVLGIALIIKYLL